MKVTKQFLTTHGACSPGIAFVTEHNLIGTDEIHFIRELVTHEKLEWAVWLLVRRLDRVGTIKFAVFCARDVLPLFEAKYPNEHRLRKAIEAAEFCITANTKANRSAAARAAAYAAYAAADAAARAGYAADAAAYAAAEAAAYAADAAAYAADAARAAYAAGYAARAADADDAAALKRYIEYGLTLLGEKGRGA